jgi:hypothetical protein
VYICLYHRLKRKHVFLICLYGHATLLFSANNMYLTVYNHAFLSPEPNLTLSARAVSQRCIMRHKCTSTVISAANPSQSTGPVAVQQPWVWCRLTWTPLVQAAAHRISNGKRWEYDKIDLQWRCNIFWSFLGGNKWKTFFSSVQKMT